MVPAMSPAAPVHPALGPVSPAARLDGAQAPAVAATPGTDDEGLRLEALRRHAILDTPPEPELDRLAQLAAALVGTPIALVSLVDQDRLWFKARLGLDRRQTPRAGSFCASAIQGRELLVVEDAREDPRFAHHPLVAGAPGVRFYAGAPLVTRDGFRLGTLCALDLRPRGLTAPQAHGLEALAACLADRLELRRLQREQRQLEQAAHASERLLRLLLDTVRASLGTLAVPGDGPGPRLAAEKPLGDPAEAVLGGLAAMPLPEQDEGGPPALAGERAPAGRCQAGALSAMVGTVEEVQAEARRLLTAAADHISRHQRLEERLAASRDELRSVFDSVPDPFFALDRQLRFTSVNQRCAELWGHTPQAMVGRAFRELLPEAAAGELGPACQRVLATGRAEQFEAIALPPGIPAEITVAPRAAGLSVHLRDITERQARERELAEAKARAEEAAAVKSRFLAQMSHEIRTPLNALLGFSELLAQTALEPAQQDYLRLQQEAGQTLLAIINDILDLARLEAGKVEIRPEPTSPGELIRGCVELFAPSASAKGLVLAVRLDPALPGWALLDRVRVRQVLGNLVANALKFTAQGEVAVTAQVRASEAGPPSLEVTVRDTGIGIPAEKLGGLFQPFTQADSTTYARFGGTGLGLAICKTLVGLMGGAIGVASTAGRGSRFWFQLPLAEARAPAAAPALPAPAAEAARRARVLLVDDTRLNRLLGSAILEQAGHAVVAVADGAEAVAAVRAGGFDFVVMDVQMPVLDGLEATRRIRRLPGAVGRVPILGCTANVLPEQRQACLEAGMDGVVVKPLRRDALLDAIQERLGAVGTRAVAPAAAPAVFPP
jgi:PAS domain S-box-containing protein